ncbi:alpha/beta hydrolase [Aestuariibacter halophilus]|uniref:Alpha/beta hydrolase n=1 Tax=Fluctibacter halophilus TaxID=226011 RepID=A0ABS8G260_9ALTE|nr:alpha/beta hydrolase-fold protein [Aestuariibacter halophilus]MCC2614677.1 alpha/beta hydrolase [Aestuariibacter halophilus]
MKSVVCSLVVLLCVFRVGASEVVSIGTSTSLTSELLQEDRALMVYLPPSYSGTDKAFPVIYLLDGDVHRFTGFVGVLESLSTDTLGNQVQQAIVVAIPNTHRSRDLTPSTVPEWTFKDRVLDTFAQSGQASRFLTFLQQELFPFIEANYRASNRRLLVGESFGGLFAADVVLQAPTTFDDYLIIDPTALWDNNYLNRTLAGAGERPALDANVFFAFANNAHLGEIGLTNYQWGTTFATAIIRQATGTAEQHYFEHETHGTVAFLAWYNGLRALLSAQN